MRIWLVDRTDETDYDETIGMVIQAETEDDARRIFTENAHFPGKSKGAVPAIKVEHLDGSGPAGVILHDFHAG